MNEFGHATHHEIPRLNNENVEYIWKMIKTIVINSAKNWKNWFNEKYKETVDRRNKRRKIALNSPTDENLERYKASKIETDKMVKRENFDGLINSIKISILRNIFNIQYRQIITITIVKILVPLIFAVFSQFFHSFPNLQGNFWEIWRIT